MESQNSRQKSDKSTDEFFFSTIKQSVHDFQPFYRHSVCDLKSENYTNRQQYGNNSSVIRMNSVSLIDELMNVKLKPTIPVRLSLFLRSNPICRLIECRPWLKKRFSIGEHDPQP